MKRFNHQLLALTASAALASTPLLAAEPDRTPQHIGAGGGAILGAVFGGPVGLILGTAFGAMAGQQQKQERQLAEDQQALAALAEQYASTQQELARAAQQLAERRAELAAGDARMAQLDQQHRALKQLVSGLELAVYFAQDSSRVEPRYQALLRSLGGGAAKVEGLQIDLAGHANASGPAAYNLKLSQSRGAAVQEQLQQHGLPPLRVQQQARGAAEVSSSNPYAPEERRVDLQLQFDAGPKGEQLFSVR